MTWKITTQVNGAAAEDQAWKPRVQTQNTTPHNLWVEFFQRPTFSVHVETASLFSIFPAARSVILFPVVYRQQPLRSRHNFIQKVFSDF